MAKHSLKPAEGLTIEVMEQKLGDLDVYETAINQLSMKERVFVSTLLRTMSVQEACVAGGFPVKDGRNIIRRPLIKRALQEAQKELRTLFWDHCGSAFHTLVALMNDMTAPPIVRLKAAQDILDRAGYKPTEKAVVLHGEIPESAVVRELMGRAAQLVGGDDADRREDRGPKRLPAAGSQ